MNFQRDGLRRILSEKGWETEVLDNYDFQMWAKETWLLRSLWTKVGTTAYLSFALDPMEIRPEKSFGPFPYILNLRFMAFVTYSQCRSTIGKTTYLTFYKLWKN
jgi:hypothetical protein